MNEQLTKITLPKGAWNSLSSDEKFSFLLLGHVYNETMILSRITHAAQPRDGATPVERAGAACQMIFFQRLLLGKLFEAAERIRRTPQIYRFLKQRCFPHLPEGEGKTLLKSFNRAVDETKWLAQARNGHCMHYPSPNDWEAAIEMFQGNEGTFELIMGASAGDMFYRTSDSVANLAFSLEAGEGDWLKGISSMRADVEAINQTLNDLIRISLNALVRSFTNKSLPSTSRAKIKQAKQFSTERLVDFRMPYFFDLRRD